MKLNKFHYGLIAVMYLTIVIINVNESFAAGGLNCTLELGTTSCPSGFVKVLGLENESGGFQNAHVQNRTLNTYNHSLCCNATTPGNTISNACGGIVLKLSAETNAHVQQSQINTYPVDACINTTLGTPTCSYETSCSAAQECLLSMASSEGDNTTNAHVGNCTAYTTKVCCSINNTSPSQVTLLYPINATSIINRTPRFNWTQSTDSDGDPITYRIQVATDSSFSTIVINNVTSALNFTPDSELSFTQYFWRVFANDSVNWSTSNTENFTVITSLVLTLVNQSINFETLSANQQNDTTNDSPLPLLIRNDGNTEMNISINATSIFSAVGLGASNYQYKADNATESNGSFVWSSSTTTFANMPATEVQLIRTFNHTDSNDEAVIDISITVPNDEPSGSKNSTIQITGELS